LIFLFILFSVIFLLKPLVAGGAGVLENVLQSIAS